MIVILQKRVFMKWEMEAKWVENGIKVHEGSLFWRFGHERKESGKAHTFTGQDEGHGEVGLTHSAPWTTHNYECR